MNLELAKAIQIRRMPTTEGQEGWKEKLRKQDNASNKAPAAVQADVSKQVDHSSSDDRQPTNSAVAMLGALRKGMIKKIDPDEPKSHTPESAKPQTATPSRGNQCLANPPEKVEVETQNVKPTNSALAMKAALTGGLPQLKKAVTSVPSTGNQEYSKAASSVKLKTNLANCHIPQTTSASITASMTALSGSTTATVDSPRAALSKCESSGNVKFDKSGKYRLLTSKAEISVRFQTLENLTCEYRGDV